MLATGNHHHRVRFIEAGEIEKIAVLAESESWLRRISDDEGKIAMVFLPIIFINRATAFKFSWLHID